MKDDRAARDHPAHRFFVGHRTQFDLGSEIAELLDAPVAGEELFSEALEAWDDCASGSLVDQTLQFFTRLYLQNGILTKVDRASMACSPRS